MSSPEITLNVTAFKASCLDLFKRLEQGKLRRITVTRRGSPVATIAPSPRAGKKKPFDEIFGSMRGLITFYPGVDLTQPVGIPDPEDQFIGKRGPDDAAT
jgi:antitoxin (DNA-binding transcriptional repressor) of toxin-antitoxin stability system